MKERSNRIETSACTDPEVGRENLDGYKYEYLDPSERRALEEHATRCAACRAALETLVPCIEPSIGGDIHVYTLGGRPSGGRAQFEQHLFVCPGCLEEFVNSAPLTRIATEEPEMIELLFEDEPLFLSAWLEQNAETGDGDFPSRSEANVSAPGGHDYRRAIVKLQGTLAEDPQNPGALLALGYCYLTLGQYKKAINFLKRCAATTVGNYHETARWRLAHAYLQTDRLEEALMELNGLIRRPGPHTDEAQHLAWAVRQMLKKEGSEDWLARQSAPVTKRPVRARQLKEDRAGAPVMDRAQARPRASDAATRSRALGRPPIPAHAPSAWRRPAGWFFIGLLLIIVAFFVYSLVGTIRARTIYNHPLFVYKPVLASCAVNGQVLPTQHIQGGTVTCR